MDVSIDEWILELKVPVGIEELLETETGMPPHIPIEQDKLKEYEEDS